MRDAAINYPDGNWKNGILGCVPSEHRNLSVPALVETIILRGEGHLTDTGSVVVNTGKYTGRAAQDKFIVIEETTKDNIWWDNNHSISKEHFGRIFQDMSESAPIKEGKMFLQELSAVAAPDYRIGVTFIGELAWHCLFLHHLLIRDKFPNETADGDSNGITIINCPSFQADPIRHGVRSSAVVALSIEKRLVLVGGTAYAGENKKAVFTLLNYLLPEQGVLPMHCSANHNPDDAKNSALFFGLSGTGKTTLSSVSERILVGDDEHGWAKDGRVFNFEGGCYAKAIRLSPKEEPEIFAASQRFGSVLENVVYDKTTGLVDFNDASLTENTRLAYPLDYIDRASKLSIAGAPKHIFMLTCDAFGVLPPVARMTPEQAFYYFLSGFTSKVSGTEQGIQEPIPTFSPCFGAPFMPRHPTEYGKILYERILNNQSSCWLINTGWTGGAYGTGHRIPIKTTRSILDQILSGKLNESLFHPDEHFGLLIPDSIQNIDRTVLHPKLGWSDQKCYDEKANVLVRMFVKNFKVYLPHVPEIIQNVALSGAV
jgi:phosphoenolpyruvate carboxykinase (ATP)